jgi:hypothetical protein
MRARNKNQSQQTLIRWRKLSLKTLFVTETIKKARMTPTFSLLLICRVEDFTRISLNMK